MMSNLKALTLSGSLRKDSYNRKLLRLAKSFATEAGASTEEADLKELALPIYDWDIENEGLPESVKKLKNEIESADVILIATPEYNYSISGALKNAIDWVSRGGNSLKGKTVAVFGTSPGRLGAVKAQLHLREILSSLNVYILTQPQVMVPGARDAFSEDGNLKDEKAQEKLKSLVVKTLEFAEKVKE